MRRVKYEPSTLAAPQPVGAGTPDYADMDFAAGYLAHEQLQNGPGLYAGLEPQLAPNLSICLPTFKMRGVKVLGRALSIA